MKTICKSIYLLCIPVMLMNAQVSYKQNFLLAISKQPSILNCEEAYDFLCCKNGICTGFNKTYETLVKANEELTSMQLEANKSAAGSNTPVNEAEGEKLASQLENMTQAEKVQWAMQNATKFMPSTGAHVNKDMDNKKVNDAVEYIQKLQRNDLQNINVMANCASQLDKIEKKYEAQKDAVLKNFQAKTKTEYNPSTSSVYGFGEASDQEVARFEQAVAEYKKEILPIYNNELKEKLDFVLKEEKALTKKYAKVEEKLASTNYSDDAQEHVNKMHLIMAHKNVLQQVMGYMDTFKAILSNHADQYASLMKKPAVSN